MASEAVRGWVQLASGLGELTRARALEAAQGLLALPGAEEVGKRAMQASTLADQLLAAAKANRAHLVALVRSEVESALRRGEFARHADVESARAALASLTHEVDELRASLASAAARIPLAGAIPGVPSAAVSTAPRRAPAAVPAPPARTRTAETAAKKATAKKATAKKATAKKGTAKKGTAKRGTAKTAAKRATAKKTTATKTARAVAKKTAPPPAAEVGGSTVAEGASPARPDVTAVETMTVPPAEQTAAVDETGAAPTERDVATEQVVAPEQAEAPDVAPPVGSATPVGADESGATETPRADATAPAAPDEPPPVDNTATRTNDT
ncbi:MAG TPA: hypothetical protein VIB11_07365 [Pedococcus sp.]|uniref:hypothetical protein n=1 Tax=Pedococcus sp. TaxID=2860345 RepID=UPI002F9364DF